MALSSFGQTYFVVLFGADFRAAFGLSGGTLGAAYVASTVLRVDADLGCLHHHRPGDLLATRIRIAATASVRQPTESATRAKSCFGTKSEL